MYLFYLYRTWIRVYVRSNLTISGTQLCGVYSNKVLYIVLISSFASRGTNIILWVLPEHCVQSKVCNFMCVKIEGDTNIVSKEERHKCDLLTQVVPSLVREYGKKRVCGPISQNCSTDQRWY